MVDINIILWLIKFENLFFICNVVEEFFLMEIIK